ncbi:hypothetical protein FOXG_20417 [Fusarium oxysporum f. sp. lycopersici 4287]|uniref:Protein kinase domain-containing protein n=2 Tax=Fusarium oxysporum TaxID=5507 RepID=A0A0J9VJ49_FUSO4|nr:hypothetical protein FOXG_20417 [Fusarium oxysporum f. sp. lycopersici 4287]EXK46482.1 hypothetical protein FOMG_00197 [Fusarium oxysporum f. sp. melonis 26406]KNB10865.1 hypothetical protein FOXG_20417 [Fusarium oxysporum f. sp. lycopersici 4287]
MDEYDFILGILLTHIDNRGCPLSTKIALKEHHDPPPEVRQRWMDQIAAAVSGLHDTGIIWGDVKAENVLIDQDSNAWVTDFGGGYTKGWVDKEVAETMEGDRMGMAKLREFVFPAASKKGGTATSMLRQGGLRDICIHIADYCPTLKVRVQYLNPE